MVRMRKGNANDKMGGFKLKKLLWILPFILFACQGLTQISRGPADWLYISPTGNNTTGDGTSGNPWATLTYACTQATSGDTIFVTAGNYTETARAALPVGDFQHEEQRLRIERVVRPAGNERREGA